MTLVLVVIERASPIESCRCAASPTKYSLARLATLLYFELLLGFVHVSDCSILVLFNQFTERYVSSLFDHLVSAHEIEPYFVSCCHFNVLVFVIQFECSLFTLCEVFLFASDHGRRLLLFQFKTLLRVPKSFNNLPHFFTSIFHFSLFTVHSQT